MKKYSNVVPLGPMSLAIVLLLVGLVASPAMAGYIFGPASEDFTYLGGTKWDPGDNTASSHGFNPPNGPMTTGGAFIMLIKRKQNV